MAAKILIISRNQEDVIFGQELGREVNQEVVITTAPNRVEQILVDEPQSVVLMEADDPRSFRDFAKSLAGRISRSRVFITTANPLNEYPGLFDVPVFGHHLRRRYAPPAAKILGRIMQSAVSPNSFGIEKYFTGEDLRRVQKIELDQSAKKTPAVEAIRSFLEKLGTTSRLAARIAQASDELLMNAIYDAPILKDGTRYRHGGSRQSSFEIDGKVVVSFGEGSSYGAISITDAFGSVDRENIMFCLKKDFRENDYVVRASTKGTGLGLRSIILSDLSVLLVTRPKMKTEAILLFPKVSTYKEIRSSFNFFGVIGL